MILSPGCGKVRLEPDRQQAAAPLGAEMSAPAGEAGPVPHPGQRLNFPLRLSFLGSSSIRLGMLA